MRLFVENDKEVSEQKPGKSEDENGGRAFVEAEANEENAASEVHGISHEFVGASSNELTWRVEWRGRAFPAGDKRRDASERQGSTSRQEYEAERTCPFGQCETQRVVIAAMQAQGDPAPKQNKTGTDDRRPQRDKERFHDVTSLRSFAEGVITAKWVSYRSASGSFGHT